MKFKSIILTGLAGIALTACTTAPKIPQLETGVLEEVQNLEVYPDTVDNKAKLTKFTNKCMIEFTGNMQAGKAIEHWSFKGNTLITGGSTVFATDGTSTAHNFDLNDAAVQKNFLALRHYFHKDALAQCN
ncbi:hypothetical protein [Acinetobacter sp. BSP-28]|uniref:hypothetical protein n=1 Tax=Acinetobacter sp. BSP-28 TaxID=3344661 RepID=UPI0037702CA3